MRPWMTAFKLFQTNCLMRSWWVLSVLGVFWVFFFFVKMAVSFPSVRSWLDILNIQKLTPNTRFYNCHWNIFLFFYFHILPSALSKLVLVLHPLCCEQVPFGPLAFMPGKLVHTNEVTALLGDNWFAKCSAKQAQKIVTHRMKCESACCSLPQSHCVIILPSLDKALLHPAEGVAASSLDRVSKYDVTNSVLAEPLLTKWNWENLVRYWENLVHFRGMFSEV